MSSFGFLYIRSEAVDYIFTASDTVGVIQENIEIDGEILPERFGGLTTKTRHLSHARSVISVGGSGWLSIWLDEFLRSARAIEGFDSLLISIKHFFVEFYRSKAMEMTFHDAGSPDFIGLIIISGPSYFEDYSINDLRRERGLLMSRKFIVYRDRVVDCGWINNESESYNGGIMEVCVPRLPVEISDKVANEAKEIMSEDFYTGSLFVLKRWLIETNAAYKESKRQGMVSAGEIHGTILSLKRDDINGETFIVSNMILHRFEDYEDTLNEIRSYGVK